MKALFISHQAKFIYGGEVCTLAFMRELARQGCSLGFASPPGPYQEQARALDLGDCFNLSSVQFSRSWIRFPGLLLAWRRAHQELSEISSGFDLLHATSLKAMVYAMGLGRRLPVIWHHHDILPPSSSNHLWLRFLASGADLILTPSEAARQALLEAGIEAGKVRALRNGFPLNEWRQRPERDPAAPFRLGFVGEISRRKGCDRLEAILAALKQQQQGKFPLELWIVGEGLTEPDFASDLKARLASPQVKFLGRRSDIKEIFQQLDLLLVPSRQDPLPTVVVEAGLSGVPVVSSRAGGLPEMVEHGHNGFFAATDEEYAEAILRSRAQWSKLSRGARAFAVAHYDVVKLASDLLGLYEEVRARADV